MKIKYILAGLAFSIVLASCGSTKEVKEEAPSAPAATMQNKTTGPGGQMEKSLPNRPRRERIDPEQLVAQLGLDEETEEKFLALWEDNAAKMKAMREEAKGDRSGMREKMKKLRDERQSGLAEILTEEQLTQLRKLTSRRMGKGGRGEKG